MEDLDALKLEQATRLLATVQLDPQQCALTLDGFMQEHFPRHLLEAVAQRVLREAGQDLPKLEEALLRVPRNSGRNGEVSYSLTGMAWKAARRFVELVPEIMPPGNRVNEQQAFKVLRELVLVSDRRQAALFHLRQTVLSVHPTEAADPTFLPGKTVPCGGRLQPARASREAAEQRREQGLELDKQLYAASLMTTPNWNYPGRLFWQQRGAAFEIQLSNSASHGTNNYMERHQRLPNQLHQPDSTSVPVLALHHGSQPLQVDDYRMVSLAAGCQMLTGLDRVMLRLAAAQGCTDVEEASELLSSQPFSVRGFQGPHGFTLAATSGPEAGSWLGFVPDEQLWEAAQQFEQPASQYAGRRPGPDPFWQRDGERCSRQFKGLVSHVETRATVDINAAADPAYMQLFHLAQNGMSKIGVAVLCRSTETSSPGSREASSLTKLFQFADLDIYVDEGKPIRSYAQIGLSNRHQRQSRGREELLAAAAEPNSELAVQLLDVSKETLPSGNLLLLAAGTGAAQTLEAATNSPEKLQQLEREVRATLAEMEAASQQRQQEAAAIVESGCFAHSRDAYKKFPKSSAGIYLGPGSALLVQAMKRHCFGKELELILLGPDGRAAACYITTSKDCGKDGVSIQQDSLPMLQQLVHLHQHGQETDVEALEKLSIGVGLRIEEGRPPLLALLGSRGGRDAAGKAAAAVVPHLRQLAEQLAAEGEGQAGAELEASGSGGPAAKRPRGEGGKYIARQR